MNNDALRMYIVYKSPADFPGLYVVRMHMIGNSPEKCGPTSWVRTSDTLRGIREHIPPELYQMPRDESDDPVVVETWF